MTVQQSLDAGNLGDAITFATNEVKRHPTSLAARVILAELNCFQGNIQRADTLIEGAIKIHGGTPSPGLLLLRQLFRGEMARKQWYDEGRPPQIRSNPTPELTTAFQAVVEHRAGDNTSATSLVSKLSENGNQQVRALLASEERIEGSSFRDLNDLTSSTAEVLSGTGRFLWIPFREFVKIQFEPVKSLRDLLWRPVACAFADGSTEHYFMPCLYTGSSTAPTDQLRLGQATDWTDVGNGLVAGIGQRMFLLGDSTVSILDLMELEFAASATVLE